MFSKNLMLYFLSMQGLLIIHKAPPTLTYFPLLIQDWYHDPRYVASYTNPHAIPAVNGSGFKVWNYNDRPYTKYLVCMSWLGYYSWNQLGEII